MSGLEVVAVVAGIVSAYAASASLYHTWQSKRTERKKQSQNQRLETSLVTGGSVIQTEYDSNFARMGKKFAVGDERARSELQAYVIKLQHVLITLMSETDSSMLIVLPSLPTILSTSHDSKGRVVAILGELYQRMAQAAPIKSLPPPPLPLPSSHTTNPAPRRVCTGFFKKSSLYAQHRIPKICVSCSSPWIPYGAQQCMPINTKDHHQVDVQVGLLLLKLHLKPVFVKSRWGLPSVVTRPEMTEFCRRICTQFDSLNRGIYHGPVFVGLESIAEHLSTHTWAELLGYQYIL